MHVFWLALTAPVFAGVLVELGEYGADVLFGTGTQEHPTLSRLDDTMTDLLAETLTALATASALAWRVRGRRQVREGPPTPREGEPRGRRGPT